MPTYEYTCPDCMATFDVRMSTSAEAEGRKLKDIQSDYVVTVCSSAHER